MFTLAQRQESYRGDATEDRALALFARDDALVLAVADGVGGRPGGGAAAQAAVDALAEVGASLANRDAQAWYRLLRAIDDALTDLPDAGETTLVALCVTPQRIVGASVGDSVARWVGPDGVLDLTAEQKRKPGLGTGGAQPIPFEVRTPRAGTLLLATDGLDKYTDPAQADTAIGAHDDLEAAADSLVALAAGPGGRLYDDLALLLCRVAAPASPATGILRWLRR